MALGRRDLEEQAERLGRSDRWVRWAIDSKMTQAGKRTGRGQGKGQTWSYQLNAENKLRALHRLQTYYGYRGKALRFAAWWIGEDRTAEVVRAYAAAIFKGLELRVERALSKEMATRDSRDAGNELITEQTEEIALRDWLDRKGKIKLEDFNIGSLIGEIFPFLHPLDDDLRTSFGNLAARIAGIDPENVESSLAYIEPDIRGSGNFFPSRQILEGVALLRLLENRDWYTDVVDLLWSVPDQKLEYVRNFMRRNIIVRRSIRSVVNWELSRQADMKDWKRIRLGPWRKPAAAYRAGALTLLVGLMRWTDNNDLDDLFS